MTVSSTVTAVRSVKLNELICNSRADGFGSEVKRRILLGNYALSSGYYDAYYGKALALRQKISAEYDSIFEKCDMILTPTTPSVAYNADENVSDPVKMYKADICTVTVNLPLFRLFLQHADITRTVCLLVCQLSERSSTRLLLSVLRTLLKRLSLIKRRKWFKGGEE